MRESNVLGLKVTTRKINSEREDVGKRMSTVFSLLLLRLREITVNYRS